MSANVVTAIIESDSGATICLAGHTATSLSPTRTDGGSDAWSPSVSRPATVSPASIRLRSQLRGPALLLAMQLVERVDVGLGRRDQDIGIGAQPVDDAAVALQAHRDLALRIGTGGDRIDRVQQHLRTGVRQLLDRLEGRIDRSIAARLRGKLGFTRAHGDLRVRNLAGFGDHLQRD